MSQAALEFSQRMKCLGEKATKYMKLRGFSVIQHNGQRISIKTDIEPTEADRLEVFVGKLPREMFEDELLPVLEQAGRVFKIRLMMDFSCTNRGFAFVKYMSALEAERACRDLNGVIIKPNTPPIGVVVSFDNKRLYFGNLPIRCTKERLAKELSNHISGIEDISLPEILIKCDRRHAIVTFVSHEAATQARRVFVPGDVKMFGRSLTIDWAKTDKTHLNQSVASSKSSSTDLISLRSDRSTPKPLRTIDYNNNNNNCSNRNFNSSGSSGGSSIISNNSNQIFGSLSNSFNCSSSNNNNSCSSSSFNYFMPHSAPNPPPTQLQLQPPSSILGAKTWQMLESCLPNPTVEPSNIITICNIDLNLAPIGNLKRIFELSGRLKITEIQSPSYNSITIAYQSSDQAEVILQALLIYPKCFERLALPNQILSAYRGSIYSI